MIKQIEIRDSFPTKAGTVITEAGTGKFSGNVIKIFNRNNVKVAVDDTRKLIMSIRTEKGFKLP